MLNTMEFWLEIGVDGFRLDAIPYLIERDGTSNENLRETHDVIKEIRRRLEAKYPGRLLLAEANMWPEDVREYFGDGDECQMAYHFPLMPRLYMAIAQEDRHPVVEILAQTPDIPANCQWAVFLRNHDELTLEMVTNKERDYMYSMYAAESRARINIGIRRRLAPLLENNPDRIKLMNSMLLSMLGTPVLYYGDEIGMGDNIFLGDRDGVRTPMQWSSDRNGGFSRADPQRLYLPPIQDPIYGFEAVNVESQSREPSSLLSWTRHLLAIRSTTQAFGRGSVTMMHPGNRKILAYLREYEGEVILCVANVSRVAQSVELDLGAYKGRVPVEMMGRSAFPPIGKDPYFLTLMAYGFFWFRLSTDAEPPAWHTDRAPVDDLAVLVLFDEWNSFFRNRVVPWRIAMAEKTRNQLEREILPRFLLRQRWYAAKTEPLERASIVEHAMLQAGDTQWLLALLDIHGAAEPARYFVPLALAFEDSDEDRPRALSAVAIAKVRQQANTGLLADAMADEPFCRAMVDAIGAKRELKAEGGTLRFSPSESFAKDRRRHAAGRDAAAAPDREQQLGQPARRPAVSQGLPAPAERHQPGTGDGAIPHRCRRLQALRAGRRQRRLPRRGRRGLYPGPAAGPGDESGRRVESYGRPAGAPARVVRQRSTKKCTTTRVRWSSACRCWRAASPNFTSRWRAAPETRPSIPSRSSPSISNAGSPPWEMSAAARSSCCPNVAGPGQNHWPNWRSGLSRRPPR